MKKESEKIVKQILLLGDRALYEKKYCSTKGRGFDTVSVRLS